MSEHSDVRMHRKAEVIFEDPSGSVDFFIANKWNGYSVGHAVASTKKSVQPVVSVVPLFLKGL